MCTKGSVLRSGVWRCNPLCTFCPYPERREEGCAWTKTVMRIIGGNHAHHWSESCASSEQIMRINGNNDADDEISNPILLTFKLFGL